MVGEMKKKDGVDTFTFHHICGALKIEIVDIFNALTFTTAETITGSFELNADGRIEIPASGDGSTVTFNYGRLQSYTNNGGKGERSNRTFFIPVPVGTLDAGATMALKNDAEEIVYQKSTSRSIAFSASIRRLSAIEFTEASDWSTVLDQSGAKVKVTFNVPDNQTYFRALLRKDQFENTYNSSVENWVEQKVTNTSTNKTLTGSDTYSTGKTIGEYYDGPSDDFDHTYVYLMCSAVDNPSTNRQFDFVYKKTVVILEDPATTEYLAWLGDWQVTEDTETDPKTDTWTITRGATNSSYVITGLVGQTSIEAQGVYSSSDHSLSLRSQSEIGTFGGKTVSLLRRSNTSGYILTSNGEYFGGLIAKLILNNGEVTISGTNYGYGYYWKNSSDAWASSSDGSLKRIKFKPLTRVTTTE